MNKKKIIIKILNFTALLGVLGVIILINRGITNCGVCHFPIGELVKNYTSLCAITP